MHKIPDGVCVGHWCPRKGVLGKVNTASLCPACSKRKRREAIDRGLNSRKAAKQDQDMRVNLMKLLSLIEALEPVLHPREGEIMRAIVQRNLRGWPTNWGSPTRTCRSY